MLIEPVIRWMRQFCLNLSPPERELTDEEVRVVARDFVTHQDPWESAAAICEGRKLS